MERGTSPLSPPIRQAAPQGLELKLDFDQSVFVRAAVTGVVGEALLASLLVSLMILFFLGSWRSMIVDGRLAIGMQAAPSVLPDGLHNVPSPSR